MDIFSNRSKPFFDSCVRVIAFCICVYLSFGDGKWLYMPWVANKWSLLLLDAVWMFSIHSIFCALFNTVCYGNPFSLGPMSFWGSLASINTQLLAIRMRLLTAISYEEASLTLLLSQYLHFFPIAFTAYVLWKKISGKEKAITNFYFRCGCVVAILLYLLVYVAIWAWSPDRQLRRFGVLLWYFQRFVLLVVPLISFGFKNIKKHYKIIRM